MRYKKNQAVGRAIPLSRAGLLHLKEEGFKFAEKRVWTRAS
ncbi:hypothetical protein [Mucilaginibacter paludis]|nr:hypothetical protein [Mucilaginibacter paludis]